MNLDQVDRRPALAWTGRLLPPPEVTWHVTLGDCVYVPTVSVRLSEEELAELDDAADLRFDADRARER